MRAGDLQGWAGVESSFCGNASLGFTEEEEEGLEVQPPIAFSGYSQLKRKKEIQFLENQKRQKTEEEELGQ